MDSAIGNPTRGATAWVLDLGVKVVRRMDVLPKSAGLGAVTYTRRLVVFVSELSLISLMTAVLLVKWNPDLATLGLSSVITFFMAVYAIKGFTSKDSAWSPAVFVNIGAAIVLGPIGALGVAFAQAGGMWVHTQNGWFRSLFNLCLNFLSNLAAWAVFWAVFGNGERGPWVGLLAGVSAGLAQYLANCTLVILLMRATGSDSPLLTMAKARLAALPFSFGFGFAAYGFEGMYHLAGAPGFISLLAPVLVLHGFLIFFARRVFAHQKEKERFQAMELILKQDKLDASENERKRIARDLHDGVVQNLVGMAYTLAAKAAEYRGRAGDEELEAMLKESAEVTRAATKDLRTLIIELAPPTLRKEGLKEALLEPMRELELIGTKMELQISEDLHLTEDRKELIFTVANEALQNIRKHAGAKQVVVALSSEGDEVLLSVRDDGKGFTEREAAVKRDEGHYGVVSMADRVAEAGGTFRIDSALGKGTEVKLRLPLRKAEDRKWEQERQ